ncbi:ATPase, T2SS/T4P/T4SS family [Vibrio harveyi]|uniref:ATPase, T2SS/T4P/T4SS family n=1 Tax=Vibrio harveyi TaxID=669 RepID=UPI003BB6366C|nr:Flp pilus assembly complex ATPase component TadA [Vibrio harveyi]
MPNSKIKQIVSNSLKQLTSQRKQSSVRFESLSTDAIEVNDGKSLSRGYQAVEEADFQELEMVSVVNETVNSEGEDFVHFSSACANDTVELKDEEPEFQPNSVNYDVYKSLFPVFQDFNDSQEIDSSGTGLLAIPNYDNTIYFPKVQANTNPTFVDSVIKHAAIASNVNSIQFVPVMVHDEDFARWAKDTYSEHLRRNNVDGGTSEQDDAATKSWLTKILSIAYQNSCTDVHMYLREEFIIKFRARKKIREHLTLTEKAIDGRRLFNTIMNDLGSTRGSGRMNYTKPEGTAFPFPVYVDSHRREKKTIELRIEKAPIVGGASQETAGIFIRLANNEEPKSFGQLNISKKLTEVFKGAMQVPQGMILVTGPTGSGKTALLHAFLKEMPEGLAARTIEDPVELRASYNTNISQMSVKKKDAQEALESVLRQDPDVVMLGEVRGQLMLDTLIQGTLTGHLTLTTLHTNGAIPTLTRMIDIGASPKDLATEELLHLIVATRLNKLPCQRCALKYEDLPEFNKAKVDEFLGANELHRRGDLRFINIKSDKCSCERGEVGMRSMQEVIFVNDKIRKFIRAEDWTGMRAYLEGNGWQDFETQSRALILSGVLDLFEVKHVIRFGQKQEFDYTDIYSEE